MVAEPVASPVQTLPAPAPRAQRVPVGLEPPPELRGGGVMTVGPQGLFAFAPDLARLAASAATANPFYELAFLDAALRHLRGEAQVELALVFSPDANPQRPAKLTGLFPVEHTQPLPGVRGLRLWRHRHCFLTAPLVDASCSEDVLGRFFDWARERAMFVEARMFPAEGALDHTLAAVVRRRGVAMTVRERWLRAQLEPERDANACLEKISGRSRKEYRRLEKGLREQHGEIAFSALAPGEDAKPWLAEFLSLESSGWKGGEGSALLSRDEDCAFFLDAAGSAHQAGQLEMIRMSAGGKTIASKCNVRSSSGPAAAFKIAFDESYAKFSPGVLLELENIRRMHAPNGAPSMDSCANPDHPMIDRLWSGRRMLQSIVVSTGARGGDAFVSMLPLLAWGKGFVRGKKK